VRALFRQFLLSSLLLLPTTIASAGLGADAPEWLSNTIRALSFGQPRAYGVVRFYDYFL
jgi:hypothetical protein